MSYYKGSGNPYLAYAVNPGQSYYSGIIAEQQRRAMQYNADKKRKSGIEGKIKEHIIPDEEDISFFLLEKELKNKAKRERK